MANIYLSPSMNSKSPRVLPGNFTVSLCSRTCGIWWALSLGVFVLLASHRYIYFPQSDKFIKRTYGWPGGWLTWNRYTSDKSTPLFGQFHSDRYITDWKSCAEALAVSLAAPGLVMLPFWRRFKWFENGDEKLQKASARFLAAALITIPVFFVLAFFAWLSVEMNQ